jgi:hypothetical protein
MMLLLRKLELGDVTSRQDKITQETKLGSGLSSVLKERVLEQQQWVEQAFRPA